MVWGGFGAVVVVVSARWAVKPQPASAAAVARRKARRRIIAWGVSQQPLSCGCERGGHRTPGGCRRPALRDGVAADRAPAPGDEGRASAAAADSPPCRAERRRVG